MLHSKSVTCQVAEGVKYQEPAKYLSAYDKDDQVDYMTLALLPKEGEVKLKLTNPKSKERKITENGTMRYEEGDFSFWHYLTVRFDGLFSLVCHQCQRGRLLRSD